MSIWYQVLKNICLYYRIEFGKSEQIHLCKIESLLLNALIP